MPLALKSNTQTKYYPLNGGLDVTTPPLSVDPGFALAIVNFEPFYNGGYRRVDGYERFDGRAKPSAAISYGVVLSGTSVPSIGTSTGVVGTGSVSGATAQIVEAVSVGGTVWLDFTNLTGTFAAGDKIVIGTSTTTGTLTTAPSRGYAPSGTGTSSFSYASEFLANAQNYYRQQIGTAPGIGPVLGAWQNGTNVYAWRAQGTSTGSAAQLYLASGTGWTTTGVVYTATQYYTNGTSTFGSGIVKGATTGATGTLYQQVPQGASFGYVAITGSSATAFGTNEVLLLIAGTSTSTLGTAASGSTTFSWPVQGSQYRYRFINMNFFGNSNTYNTYGVNGYGPAFQIDQSNVVMPILMPLSPLTNQPASNTPFLLSEFNNWLVLAFPGGMVQISVQGVPYEFNGFLGAAQIGVGAEITGLNAIVGGNLIVNTQHNAQILSGTSGASLALGTAAERAGAQLYSAVLLDTVYAINSLGITSLSRTQSYGNFVGATVSQLIQPIIQAEFPNFVDASFVRKSNQTRFYFNDGTVLIGYVPGLGQQNKAWAAIESGVTMQFGLASYPTIPYAVWTSEDQANNEVAYFSGVSGDGFVYQDRSGTSWDGVDIKSYVRLAFNNLGSPAIRKYFRRADLELNSPSQINLQFAIDLSYDSNESLSNAQQALTAATIPVLNVFGGGGYWDQVNWNNFYWDGQTISQARATLWGTGTNASFLIYHDAIVDQPFVLQGLTLYYDPRRLQR